MFFYDLKCRIVCLTVSYFLICVNCTNGTNEFSVSAGRPWISNIVATVMMNYYPYGENVNSLCTKHGRLIEVYSKNYTIWALRMIDSFSKSPSGVIYGNLFDYGHYDQCISTVGLNNTIKGEYVMISLEFWRYHQSVLEDSEINSYEHEFLLQNDSFWNLIESSKKPWNSRIKERNKINWAICVPDSCSAGDVLYSVKRTLLPVLTSHGLHGNISVLEAYSNSSRAKPWTLEAIIFLSLTAVLLLIEVLATLFEWMFIDETSKYLGRFEKFIQKFSFRYNLAQLSRNDEAISVISGMKVISMFLIIYGHRMFITMFSPIHNTYDNEKAMGKFLNTYYFNGILIVDTFLVITGFLSLNKMLKTIEKYDYINPLRCIYRRFMRFTPTYAFVIGLIIWIIPYLESGPMTQNVIWNSTNCSWSWWTHLLYVNNYVHSHNQCFIQSWYLATDMQLYVLCTFIAFVSWRVKKVVGLILLVLTSLISLIVPSAILFLKDYKGVTLLYLSDFASYYDNDEFVETYLQTHFRAIPYVIGMLAAWVYRKIERSNIIDFKRKYKLLMAVLNILHFFSMNVSILSAWWFYNPSMELSSIYTILYSVLHRIGWAIPVSWIILMHTSNISAPFQKILGLSQFGPLNQINFSVFLIHTPVQLYIASQNRTPVFFNWLTSWWFGAGDIVFCYGAALILHITIEAPFMNVFL